MERFVTLDGARLWTTSDGSGPLLILLNGGPGCDDYLAPVAVMVEEICQVVRFEPRGCGRSDYDGRYDLKTAIGDLDGIRAAYGQERALLCGHSAGVDLALAYAMAHPQHVLGIVGIAGGRMVDDREWSRIYHENLDKIGESYGGKEFIADPLVNEIGNRSWKEYIKREHLLSDLARIAPPVIFIGGTEDIRPAWPTRQLASLIPRATYEAIEGAPHNIWLTHPDELKRLLRQSIERIIGPPEADPEAAHPNPS